MLFWRAEHGFEGGEEGIEGGREGGGGERREEREAVVVSFLVVVGLTFLDLLSGFTGTHTEILNTGIPRKS